MVFSFTVDRSLVPRFDATEDTESNKNSKDSEKEETGKVYLYYSNYKVNIGLSDELFDKKDTKK